MRPVRRTCCCCSAFAGLIVVGLAGLVVYRLAGPGTTYPPGRPIMVEDFDFAALRAVRFQPRRPDGPNLRVDVKVVNSDLGTDYRFDPKTVTVTTEGGEELKFLSLGGSRATLLTHGEEGTFQLLFHGGKAAKTVYVEFHPHPEGAAVDNIVSGRRRVRLDVTTQNPVPGAPSKIGNGRSR